MKIEVKLYSFHDMELVSMYKSGRIMFPETTRQILNAYAKHEAYKVKLLEPSIKRVKRTNSDTFKKFYHYYVNLDEKRDRDAIKLIESITPGCRNSFIKILLRQYICCEIPSGYNIDGNNELFKTMSKVLKGNFNEKEIKLEPKGFMKQRTKSVSLLEPNDSELYMKQSSISEKQNTTGLNSSPKSSKTLDDSSKHLKQSNSVSIPEQQRETNQKRDVSVEVLKQNPQKNVKAEEMEYIRKTPRVTTTVVDDEDEFDIDKFLSGAVEQY